MWNEWLPPAKETEESSCRVYTTLPKARVTHVQHSCLCFFLLSIDQGLSINHLTTSIPQVCTLFPNSDHPSRSLVWPPRPAALRASISGRPPTCHLSALQLHLRPDSHICPVGPQSLWGGESCFVFPFIPTVLNPTAMGMQSSQLKEILYFGQKSIVCEVLPHLKPSAGRSTSLCVLSGGHVERNKCPKFSTKWQTWA